MEVFEVEAQLSILSFADWCQLCEFADLQFSALKIACGHEMDFFGNLEIKHARGRNIPVSFILTPSDDAGLHFICWNFAVVSAGNQPYWKKSKGAHLNHLD